MSNLLCKCGEGMSKSVCPSPYSIEVFYKEEIENALKNNPDLELHDFLTGWDEKNNCAKEYRYRSEPVDYWYCPICKRVYEAQLHVGGRWVRVYKRASLIQPENFDGWKQIFIFPESETDDATEKNYRIKLRDYLEDHSFVLYYASQDERIVHAVDSTSSDILYSYEIEDAWTPPNS